MTPIEFRSEFDFYTFSDWMGGFICWAFSYSLGVGEGFPLKELGINIDLHEYGIHKMSWFIYFDLKGYTW
jgi:hypothetical protein